MVMEVGWTGRRTIRPHGTIWFTIMPRGMLLKRRWFREISAQFVYESAVMVNGGDKALEIAKVCMTPDNYIIKSQYWDELDGIGSPTRYLGTPPRGGRGRSSGFLHHYRNGIG